MAELGEIRQPVVDALVSEGGVRPVTTKRDQALARLAQQLQVPPRLLDLYPPAANHWTAVDADQQDWRDLAWATFNEIAESMTAELRGWTALYDGPPAEPTASCYKVPCPPWPRDLAEPDPCSIGDCLTCPGIGCGCECHWADWAIE